MLHATAVAWHGRGLLLRGASGAGKSALALRLIAAGGQLVADDLVTLTAERGRLVARPHRGGADGPGLIEARGLGIFRLGTAHRAALALAVDLVEAARIERLPEPGLETLLGVSLPRIALDGARPDAPARLLLALLAPRVA